MTLDEALDLVEICKTQLKTRFLVNSPSYIVKIIDKDGIGIVPQKTGNTEVTEVENEGTSATPTA